MVSGKEKRKKCYGDTSQQSGGSVAQNVLWKCIEELGRNAATTGQSQHKYTRRGVGEGQ